MRAPDEEAGPSRYDVVISLSHIQEAPRVAVYPV
jgi:hypothetical protein